MQAVVALKQGVGSEQPVFYFVGLHSDSGGIDGDYFRHLLLPVLTLTVQIIASWSRFPTRLDARRARLRLRAHRPLEGPPRAPGGGAPRPRNTLIPLVTVMALDAGALFGGLIITETLFSIPGMGKLFYDALLAGDVYVVMAWMVVAAVFVVLFNLFADLGYSVLDPGSASHQRSDPPGPLDRTSEDARSAEAFADGVIAGVDDTPATSPTASVTTSRCGRGPSPPGSRPNPGAAVADLPAAVLPATSRPWWASSRCSSSSSPASGRHGWRRPARRAGPAGRRGWSHPRTLVRHRRPRSDYLSEVLYAGRVSLAIGLGVGLLSTLIGSTVGLVSPAASGARRSRRSCDSPTCS